MRYTEEETREELEKFKAEVFWPDLRPSLEIQAFVQNLSSTQFLRDLSVMDLQERCIQLAHYGLFLTTQENRLKSYISYCENNIKVIVGRLMQEAYGFSFQEKDLYIRTHDDNAQTLQNNKDHAQVKLEYIMFLSQKISVLIDTIKGLCFEKNRVNRL